MSKFITIIRPDFMQFCHDACKAATLNHLLFRIAGKSKDKPKEQIIAGDILWYANTSQITEEMSNAWGVCKVRKEVNALISLGVIGRKNNPEWGADRTKHFCFGEEQCRTFLELCEMHQICVVHVNLPPEVMHLIYSSNANDKSIKCICAIHQMELIDVSNANDEYIEAIPKEIPTEDRHTIDDDKEGETSREVSLHTSNVRDIEAMRKRKTDPRMLALSASSHSQRLSETNAEEEEDAPTEKVPVISKGTIDGRGRNTPDNTDDLSADVVCSDLQGDTGNTNRTTPTTLSARRGAQADIQQIASQHSPGAGTRSLASTPPGDGQDDSTSSQALTVPPVFPSSLTPQAARAPVASELPPGVQRGAMAMTARQIKAQAEKRAKELWAIIEDELHTTFTENQRKAHKDGIALLIADDISDEAIRTGLQALNTFERRTFTVSKFYGWLPTLSAKAPIFLKKASNGYQRDMVEWQGRYMTVEEADTLGFNGGFGEYL